MDDSTKLQDTTDFNESAQLGMDRSAMLTISLENVFEKVSSCVSEQDYSEVLGKITKSKSIPGKVRNKMKMKLFHGLSEEVNRWIEEEEIIEKLKKLDKIVEECPSYNNSKTWRPNGDVQDYMRSMLITAKLKLITAVEEDIKDREREIESLREQVSGIRSEVKALLHAIQEISRSISTSQPLDSLDCKVMECVDILSSAEV